MTKTKTGDHPELVPQVRVSEDGYPERLWTMEEFLIFGNRYMPGLGTRYGDGTPSAENYIATFASLVNNDWAPGCCSIQMARYLKGYQGSLPNFESYDLMAMIVTQFLIAAARSTNKSVRIYQINITGKDFPEEQIEALQRCGWTIGAQCESRYGGYDVYCMFFDIFKMEDAIGLEHPDPIDH